MGRTKQVLTSPDKSKKAPEAAPKFKKAKALPIDEVMENADVVSLMTPTASKTKNSNSQPTVPKVMPKKPMQAYMFYSIEHAPKVRAEGKPTTEVAKIVGANWKLLTDDAKKKYFQMAEEDKARFNKETE